MDLRSTRVAFIEDATLAMEWEDNHNHAHIDDEELAIQLFAEETRAVAYEDTDYTLARRMQEEEHRGALPGPSNHRRTRSADVVMGRPNRRQQQRNEAHSKVSAIVGRVAHTFVRRGTVPGRAPRTFLSRPSRRPEPHECVICRIYITGVAIRVPCGHYYDIGCLRDLIQASTRDESLFPPRCCQQNIPRGLFESHLDSSLSALFSEKSIEFGTLKRVYCSKPFCSRFLGPRSTSGIPYVFVCPVKSCCTRTCGRCRQEVKSSAKHSCPTFEKAEKELVKLSRKTGWAPCPGCERMIELRAGCFHMTCICKTQFCYRCCAIWKTCKCPQWDELHLTEETTRRISLLPPLQAVGAGDMLPEVVRPATPELFLLRPVNRPPFLANTQNTVQRGRPLLRGASPARDLGSPPTPPPKRATIDGPLSTTQTDSPPGPEQASGSGVQVRPRASAPAAMKARESMVARGVQAQERRQERKRDLSHRRIDSASNPKVPRISDAAGPDTMETLEERINRLLRVVEHFPCQHRWKSENEHSVCDGCHRSGSILAMCSRCATRACIRCQVNRI